MLKTVGTGIAVKNAVMELKEVSNLICDNIYNNSIKNIWIKTSIIYNNNSCLL